MPKIKSIKFIGNLQTYDLEVDHPDHQFYLANGILTSNSHSVLYSKTSYKTAYAKAHFPVEFMLANLLSELKSSAKKAPENIAKIKSEIRAKNIRILKPDIDRSEYNYKIINGTNLLTGFSAMKKLQEKAINDIINKRPFTSFFDFMSRTDGSKVQSPTIQALIACGCFDHFGLSRKSMFIYCQDYKKKLQTWLKKHDPKTEVFEWEFPADDWTIPEKYAMEMFYMGEAFVCTKTKAYYDFYRGKANHLYSMIKDERDKYQINIMRCIVETVFFTKVKKEGSKQLGQEMAILNLSDQAGVIFGATMFPSALQTFREKYKELVPEIAIAFEGAVNHYNDNVGVVIENVFEVFDAPALPSDKESKKRIKQNKKELEALVEGLVEKKESSPLDFMSKEDIIEFLGGTVPEDAIEEEVIAEESDEEEKIEMTLEEQQEEQDNWNTDFVFPEYN